MQTGERERERQTRGKETTIKKCEVTDREDLHSQWLLRDIKDLSYHQRQFTGKSSAVED